MVKLHSLLPKLYFYCLSQCSTAAPNPSPIIVGHTSRWTLWALSPAYSHLGSYFHPDFRGPVQQDDTLYSPAQGFTSMAFLSIRDPRSLSVWLTGSGILQTRGHGFPPVSSLSPASLLSSSPRSGTGDFLLPTLPVVWTLRRTMSSDSVLLVSPCLLPYPNFLWQCEFLCSNLWLPL